MSGLLSVWRSKSRLRNLCSFVIHSEIRRWIGSLGLVWGRVMVTDSVHQVALTPSLTSRVVHVMGLCPVDLMLPTVDANWRALIWACWVNWGSVPVAISEKGMDRGTEKMEQPGGL